jgi:hypothetical protein
MMIPHNMAAAISRQLNWKCVAHEKGYYLVSDASFPDGQAIHIHLDKDKDEKLLLIHDMGATFARFRKQGQFTGRGRLETFVVLCKAICETHGVELKGERLLLTATHEDAPAACRKILNVISAIIPYSHPTP